MFEARIRNEHTAISIDETRRLVRMRRTSVRADTVAELTAALELLLTGLDQVVPPERRGEYGFLQDMRDAPLLRDAVLESKLAEYSPRLRQGWGRLAVLIRTPVGRLQVRRTTATDGESGRGVFDDEIEALNFLTQRP